MATTSTTSTVTDEGFKVEPVASVYNVLNNNNDYVSQATGALTYEKTLLSLPGVNGLDLNLSVRYNSDDAVITQNQFIDTSDHVRNINFNNFAIGWNFGFPSIVKKEVEKSYGWDRETSLVFPDGSSYKILGDNGNNHNLRLQHYKLSDMKLVKYAGANIYELIYTNGTIYTFDGVYGNLTKIRDRFGNKINFKYTEFDYSQGSFWDYMFNFSYYKAKINVLSEIVDSAGRVVKIEYDLKNTLNGKQLNKIEIKLNNKTYATLYFERRTTYGGPVDVLNQIIISGGFPLTFNYDEKASFIYNSNNGEPTYTLNGNVLALTRVDLPTGGWVKYDYTKARRTYLYYDGSLNADWHEVYKVSKVSDSSGYKITYEYENDRSGYPYSYLSTDPIVYEGYSYSQQTTGYVVDEDFTYSCIVREKEKTTVSTFDYMHNKIGEYTYNENNTQNSYVSGNGQTKWNAVVGNYIYSMGYSDEVNKKTYFHKQHTGTGEAELLTPYDGEIDSTDIMKSSGSSIFVFSKTPELKVRTYDPWNNRWKEDCNCTNLDSYALNSISFDTILYKNNNFYIRGTNGCTVYYVKYNTLDSVNSGWEYWETTFSEAVNNSTLNYLFTFDVWDYYYDGSNIYQYNIVDKTYTCKSVGLVVSSGGFETEGRMFMLNDTYISLYRETLMTPLTDY